jgi:hypothetical protein
MAQGAWHARGMAGWERRQGALPSSARLVLRARGREESTVRGRGRGGPAWGRTPSPPPSPALLDHAPFLPTPPPHRPRALPAAYSFLIPGAKNITARAEGNAFETTISGLKPSSFYVFTIISHNGLGSSDEPAVNFHPTPAVGQKPPGPPTGLSAGMAVDKTVALSWQPPAGSPADFYNIG